MGRYDWEEKQRKRETALAPSNRTGSWLAVAALCLILIGVAAAAFSSSRQDNGLEQTATVEAANTPVVPMAPASEKMLAVEDQAVQKSATAETEGTNLPKAPEKVREPSTFDRCGMVRRTCVVDGDTIWLQGEKIRVADIDTPEISRPKCPYEKMLGNKATDRLIELLNEGPFELALIGNRDEDQYGRKLRVLVRGGKSLGDQLVAEGLARTWTGRREPWC